MPQARKVFTGGKIEQPGLVFVPREHAYYLDGEKLPSVTRLTGGLYNGPRASPERLAETANLGSEIHSLTETDDVQDVTGEDVPGWLYLRSQHAGERAAWRAWRRTRKFTPLYVEARMASKRWKVAGTVDRIGTFEIPDPVPDWWDWPVEQGGRVTGIVDIKTGSIPDMCAAQMAAYRHMAVELGLAYGNSPLVAVAIRDDGSWWDCWYRGETPDALWQAAWSVHYRRPECHRDPPAPSEAYLHRRAS